MEKPGLNIADIRESILRHARTVAIVTVVSMALGGIFYIFGPKWYKAQTQFFVRNPLYSDRTVLFNMDSRLYNYFTGDEDLDRVMVFATNDIVQKTVMRDMKMAEVYNIDTTSLLGRVKLEKKFNHHLNISRTEYKSLVLTFEDKSPERAAATADEFVRVLDSAFSGYYKEMRRDMSSSIQDKIHEQDSTINALTDTLVAIRDRYGIYSSRYNVTLNSGSSGKDKIKGEGVEQLENIEALKDALVADKVGELTLMNHYRTGLKDNQLPMIKIMTRAKIVNPPNVVEGMLMVLMCGSVGFLFSVIILFMSDSIKYKTI